MIDVGLPAADEVDLPDARYCVLTTHGRVTGRRHTAELWFLPAEGGVWMMSGSGGLTSWCLNLSTEGQGVVRIGDRSWLARASVLQDDASERDAVLAGFEAKYPTDGPERMDYWQRHATVLHLVFVREL